MKVKNLNYTSHKRCKCGSWIQHWHNFSGRVATQCKAKGCSNDATVGAHVIKVNSTDKYHYIIPFCHPHNKNDNTEIEINGKEYLVSANVSLTCK